MSDTQQHPQELTYENVTGIVNRLRDQVFRALESQKAPEAVVAHMNQIFNDTLVGIPSAEVSQAGASIHIGQQTPLASAQPQPAKVAHSEDLSPEEQDMEEVEEEEGGNKTKSHSSSHRNRRK
jgi:hypothetical protein